MNNDSPLDKRVIEHLTAITESWGLTLDRDTLPLWFVRHGWECKMTLSFRVNYSAWAYSWGLRKGSEAPEKYEAGIRQELFDESGKFKSWESHKVVELFEAFERVLASSFTPMELLALRAGRAKTVAEQGRGEDI